MRSISFSLRLLLIALVVALLTASQLKAQEYPAWWDSLYFENVCLWYPGEPDTGRLNAQLYWTESDSNRFFAIFFWVEIQWTGSVACDSFVRATSLADSLFFTTVDIDNDSQTIVLIANTMGGASPGPGTRKLGNLYGRVTDTCLIGLSSASDPWFAPVQAVGWYGTFAPTAYRVSNPGDFNADGIAGDVTDAVWLVGYIFGNPDPEEPVPFADANGDCVVNISDVVYLIWYIFADGPAPTPGCEFYTISQL